MKKFLWPGVLIIVGLGAIVVACWWFFRGDDNSREQILKRARAAKAMRAEQNGHGETLDVEAIEVKDQSNAST